MDNKKRAEKIDADIYGLTPEARIKIIVSQLDEAVREAIEKELYQRMNNLRDTKAFEEGFALARDIVEGCHISELGKGITSETAAEVMKQIILGALQGNECIRGMSNE